MKTMSLDSSRFGRLTSSVGKLHLIATHAGAGVLDKARNDAVKTFLDDPTYAECGVLLFIDSDMGWSPDSPEVLARTIEQADVDIVGGLCFGQKVTGASDMSTPDTEWFPTLYRFDSRGAFDTAYDYPPDTVVEVGATGGAFIAITRHALETMRADGDCWFTPTHMDGHTKPFGEDMSFCIRARRHGFPTHVHTGVKTTHRKDVWITESAYRQSRAAAASAVTVVIPVKDELEMTRSLVGDLLSQGGYTDLLIFDNGSTDPEMVEWLASQDVASVYDATGAGIHDMWNAGIAEALNRHHGLADIVFLNNDLRCGPRFLHRLVAGLRSQPGLMAACGNYDGRPGSGVTPLRGICANRYDGTGGLAGFAFALRAEWIASGYRFPTDMRWWYGDNDLVLEVEKAGMWYGLVSDALVQHLDGGSKTDRPDGWDEIVAADRAAFEAKWPHVTLTAA